MYMCFSACRSICVTPMGASDFSFLFCAHTGMLNLYHARFRAVVRIWRHYKISEILDLYRSDSVTFFTFKRLCNPIHHTIQWLINFTKYDHVNSNVLKFVYL